MLFWQVCRMLYLEYLILNELQKSIPQTREDQRNAVLLAGGFDYTNSWIARPLRSLGSNQVVLGGMMLQVSGMLISCCIVTG